MRRSWRPWLLVSTLLGCGDPPAPTRGEVEALLQRLDAMEERLDAIEEAVAKAPADPVEVARAEPPRPPRLTTTAQEPATADSLHVHVRADAIEIDGKDFTTEQAAEHFERVATQRPETRLVVLSEPDVPYARMIEVLDLAREAGLEDFAMKARVHGSDEAEGTARPRP